MPEFEKMLVLNNTYVFKLWFSVSREEQARRVMARWARARVVFPEAQTRTCTHASRLDLFRPDCISQFTCSVLHLYVPVSQLVWRFLALVTSREQR